MMLELPTISNKERQYYRKMWGFDPVTDAKSLSPDGYAYSHSFPLTADPQLFNANVSLMARVQIRSGSTHNEIIFERENKQVAIGCLHTIVFSASAQEALAFADDLERDARSGKLDESLVPIPKGLALLSPLEHYVALQSYVAAIAEVGLGNILKEAMRLRNNDVFSLPFGFNDAMQVQFSKALAQIAPEALQAMIQDVFLEVLEDIPRDEINEWLPKIAETYGLEDIILQNPQVFDCVADKLEPLLLHDMDMIHGKTEPSIKNRIANLYINQVGINSYPLSFQQILELLKRDRYLEKESGRGFRTKWRAISLVEEMADIASNNEFMNRITTLSQLIDLRELLFERPVVFEHVDKTQHLPILRVIAAIYPKTHPAILDYLNTLQPPDFGLRDCLFVNPNLWESTKAEWRKYPHENSPTYHFCGEELPAKIVFSLCSIQRCISPHPLLVDKYSDMYRSIPKFKYGGFKVENGQVIELNLGGLGLVYVPSEIWEFPMLQKLDLHGNVIRAVPEIPHSMPFLQTLDLSENLLDTLPISITQLTSLTLLDIHKNYSTKMPQAIANLRKLQIIS